MGSWFRRGFALAVLIVGLCAFGLVDARADGADWLVGHWDGHNTNKADGRTFAMDITGINTDQSFAVRWTLNGNAFPAKGTVDTSNAVNIALGNGTKISLFRSSDGSLAGTSAQKDGSSGANFVFVKSGSAAAAAATTAPSGSGQGCDYKPVVTKGQSPTLRASDGDEVVTHLGVFRCTNGRLVRSN
jgi:hypothetical protein